MGARAIDRRENGPPLEKLVRNAQRGDFEAFEQIYKRTAGLVHALCLRMTGNRARAEDLTQDAFVRAWEGIGTVRDDREFSAWLRRLVVNVILSDRRSRSRHEDRESADSDVLEFRPASPATAPATTLDLEKAVAGLPPKARMVFVLHDVEGYRHAEIGRLLDVAEGTSKAQLHRARKILREALRP